MLIITLFLCFATVATVGYILTPAIYGKVAAVTDKRQQKISNKMEQLMPRQEAKKISRLFVIAPLVLGGGFYLVFPEDLRLFGVFFGVIIGLVFPGMYVQALTARIKDQFNNQLVDALMIMSSSFRGGLSLVQALEAVVDEMPDPINKEFGIVLGENKMGVSLEEALNHLYARMKSPALQQMITAILLARETGGNLPVIFNRIVTNIRESKKIQQNLDTLTIQGKIQGVVMSILPVAFAFLLYSSNRKIFDGMLSSELGRTLLIYAIISETIGAFMIWKISSFKDF
ncbi:MAG TPA: type II secretion system F family protein [Candidatus Omnitrophota bacterium]|nr:type II secretion system F family protein [Candidatus Omnitrophota bacterium]